MVNKLTWTLLAFVACSALPLPAQQLGESSLKPALAALDSLAALHVRSAAERDSLNRSAEELAGEVSRLKSSQARDYSALEQYRLEAALRRSQAVAARLDSLNARIGSLGEEFAGRKRSVLSLIDRELGTLAGRLESSPGDSLRSAATARIESLRRLRAQVSSLQVEKPRAEGLAVGLPIDRLLEQIRVTPADSPEEIQEKADFLADVARRWRKSLEDVERSIGRLADEREMRRRLGEFTQELSLFDATSPSSRAGLTSSAAGQPDQARAGEPGITSEPKGLLDITNESHTTALPEIQPLDVELSNPEAGVLLLQNIDQFSSDELKAVLEKLTARRDSLAQGFDRLRQAESEIRRQAGASGREQEGSPPQ